MGILFFILRKYLIPSITPEVDQANVPKQSINQKERTIYGSKKQQ